MIDESIIHVYTYVFCLKMWYFMRLILIISQLSQQLCDQSVHWFVIIFLNFIIPAKARDYVFTGVGLCLCVFVCDHDN